MTGLHPYAALEPDLILGALESIGLHCDGRLLALNSFENRVFQVGVDDGSSVVAKFYRPDRWTDAQILEEHALTGELAAAEIPAVAPLVIGGATLHCFAAFRFSVFPRQGGRAAEFDREEILEWMGRYLGRLHAVGARTAFCHRPAIDIATFGEQARDSLLAGGFLPADIGDVWHGVVDQALASVRRGFEQAGAVDCLRLHGDCHAGNVLWTDHGPHFVDFDDSRNGPAMQDLWMLLSGDAAAMARQLGLLLRGYEQFRDFDDRELHLIEPLRTLRLLHYSAWIAGRWQDPAFPAAFPWFGSQRYWQDRILELREQIALMDEPPIRPA